MDKSREKLEQIESKFNAAMNEFTRQSGYVEGTLDTIIAMMMDAAPEVAMTSDKLIKTFHAIEGICKQGLLLEFQAMSKLCKDLLENQKTEVPEKANELDSEPSLDDSIGLIVKKAKGIKNGH